MLRIKSIWALGLPVVLSLAAVISRSALFFALWFLVHFFVVKKMPACKGRENVWMFILVAISSIPFNIYMLYLMNSWGLIFDSLFILGIFRCVLYYTILFSLEEVFMGVITRIIWKKQYKLL